MGAAARNPRHYLAALGVLLLLAASLLVLSAAAARGGLTSSKAKSAVISYVKRKWGSSYAVHPACYSLGSKKSKCFVHMVHNSSSCTKYATVTLRGRRASVSMARPSC